MTAHPTCDESAPVAQRIEHLASEQRVGRSNLSGRAFISSRDGRRHTALLNFARSNLSGRAIEASTYFPRYLMKSILVIRPKNFLPSLTMAISSASKTLNIASIGD